jgi:exosortase/archaeosortase family protein
LPALLVLLALLLQFGAALGWLAHTWTDPSYGSAGLLPLLLLLPYWRRLPPRRSLVSLPHLWGVCALCALDGAVLAGLDINVLRAAAGLFAIHLWLVAFRDYRGRWFSQAQLWIGLLTLPLVYWGNAVGGYHLQHLAARCAAAGLRATSGTPVTSDGTLLSVGAAGDLVTVAVDSSCSGLNLLYCGLLLGIVAASTARPRLGLARGSLFWIVLLSLLFAANVLRIMSLATAHLLTGNALGTATHEAIGLVAFVVVAALPALLLLRTLKARRAVDAEPGDAQAAALATERRAAKERHSWALCLTVCAIACGSAARPAEPRAMGAKAVVLRLPLQLESRPGRPLPLSQAERRLARSPRVHIERRAYGGTTQVALVTVSDGVKELHAPTTCLEADGFEIVSKRREAVPRHSGGGCVAAMRVRAPEAAADPGAHTSSKSSHSASGDIRHFYFAYITPNRQTGRPGPAECGYVRQTAAAIWHRLVGKNAAGATLQVMDTDPHRARRSMLSLLAALRAGPTSAEAEPPRDPERS